MAGNVAADLVGLMAVASSLLAPAGAGRILLMDIIRRLYVLVLM